MKVAVCISGQLRTFRRCSRNLMKYLIEPNGADVFVSTWSQTGLGQEEIRSSDLKEVYPLQFFNIETFSLNYSREMDGVVLPEELIKSDPRNSRGAIPLFYHMNKCNELRNRFEKEHDFSYDAIVRIRPDLLLKERLIIPKLNSEDLFCCDYAIDPSYQVSDKFAFGGSLAMDGYSSVFNNLNEYWKNPLGEDGKFESYRLGERLMKFHLNSIEQTYEWFGLKCKILRPFSFRKSVLSLSQRIFRHV